MAGIVLLIIADIILALGNTIHMALLGVVFWGLHMGLARGFSPRSWRIRRQLNCVAPPLACSTLRAALPCCLPVSLQAVSGTSTDHDLYAGAAITAMALFGLIIVLVRQTAMAAS